MPAGDSTPPTASSPAAAATVDPYADGAVGDEALRVLEATVRYNNWLCGHLRPYLGDSNVELGAGHGTLTALIGKTHRVQPVEPSEPGRAALARRFADHARILPPLPLLTDVPTDASADCIYSSNVLEHIEDDLAVLSQAVGRLRPAGYFVALVPAGMWLFSEFDRSLGHHRRYTQADRRRICRHLHVAELPLSMRCYRMLNPIGALGWFVKMRLLKKRHIAPQDAAMVERLVPLFSVTDALRLPFGQTALIVLQKHADGS